MLKIDEALNFYKGILEFQNVYFVEDINVDDVNDHLKLLDYIINVTLNNIFNLKNKLKVKIYAAYNMESWQKCFFYHMDKIYLIMDVLLKYLLLLIQEVKQLNQMVN